MIVCSVMFMVYFAILISRNLPTNLSDFKHSVSSWDQKTITPIPNVIVIELSDVYTTNLC